MLKAIDENRHSSGLFLDIQKVFEMGFNETLLSKLYNIGIRGTAFNWLKSYLTNHNRTLEISVYEHEEF